MVGRRPLTAKILQIYATAIKDRDLSERKKRYKSKEKPSSSTGTGQGATTSLR